MRPGEWYPTEPAPPKNRKITTPTNRKKRKTGHKQIERKKDWGLPEGRAGSVGLTRSIRVECEADRLYRPRNQVMQAAKPSRLGPRTEDAVDEFVIGDLEPHAIVGHRRQGHVLAARAANTRRRADAEQRYRDLAAAWKEAD